jgi:hypothetical protein
MRFLIALSAATIVSIFGLTAGQAADSPSQLNGDQILARAGAAEGLHSFSVPVHLDVHLHKPMGFKAGMSGTAYYKAPAQSAFVITKAPPIIGGFFKGQYNLDLIPQAWPAKYKVTSSSNVTRNGVSVYELTATPRAQIGVDRVVFDVAKDGFVPLTAQWFYHDGSTIGLSLGTQRVSNYTLPQTESVRVSMPKYNLDATSSFGQYALNVPVQDSVFVTK